MRFGWDLTKRTFAVFMDAKPFNYSATVAFYTIFSLPAILLIVLFVAGTTFDVQEVRSELFAQIRSIVGADGTEQIKQIIENARLSGSLKLMNIAGIGLLLFSATTVFAALQDSLNMLWGVKPNPKNVVAKFFLDRLLSFGVVVSFGFIMLVFLVIDALLAILRDYISTQFPDFMLLFIEAINFSLSGIIIFMVFSLIYKVLPDTKLKWRQVWLGALLTTLLFIGGKFLINFYLQNSQFTTTYGVAGSLVAILLWIYFSCLLLFLGASFVKAYAMETGKRIRPARHAVAFKTKELEEQNVQ
jgi:membrane protein